MVSWKEHLDEFNDKIIYCTLPEQDLAVEFDGGYGGTNGAAFTAWSEKYVYFPVCYDGAEKPL